MSKDQNNEQEPINKPHKILFVGPHEAGKSALAMRHLLKRSPEGGYIVQSVEGMDTEVSVFGRTVVLRLNEIHVHDGLTHASYLPQVLGTEVAVVCFAIDSPSSLSSAEYIWTPLAKERTAAPIIFVGCKSDTRNGMQEQGKKYVSTEEGKAAAERIGAVQYLECSAFSGEGVDDVFNHAARIAVRPLPKLKKVESKDKCIVF